MKETENMPDEYKHDLRRIANGYGAKSALSITWLSERDLIELGMVVGAAIIAMAEVIRARFYCRCDEFYAWCPVHDTCLRCQELLESDDPISRSWAQIATQCGDD